MNRFQIISQIALEFFQKNWKILLISALLYFYFLLSNLPANLVMGWVLPARHPIFTIAAPTGSIWSGKTSNVTVRGISINNIEWQLGLFSLLTGQLNIDFSFRDSDSRGSGELYLSLGGGNVELENFKASMPITKFTPLLVVPVKLTGKISAHFESIIYEPGEILNANGNLVWNSASATALQTVQLGDLKLHLEPKKNGSTGVFTDAGGPLILDGTIQITNKGRFQTALKVGTRSTAEKALKQSLKFIGKAGADGKYQIRRSGRLPL